MAFDFISALIIWTPASIPWLMYYFDRKEKHSLLGSIAGFYGTLIVIIAMMMEQSIKSLLDNGWGYDILITGIVGGLIAIVPIILLSKTSKHRDVRIVSIVLLGLTVLLTICIPFQMYLAEGDQDAIKLLTFAAAIIFSIIISIIPIQIAEEDDSEVAANV